MRDNRCRRMAALCVVIALSVAIVAAIGVFARGDIETQTVVSERGETYAMVTDGIYAYNSERMLAEGIGWDLFTLIVAVPLLLATVPGVLHGSLRARLVAIGLLGYFFYQYLMYALGWAFGPLFVPFIAVYAVSLFAAVWMVSTIDISSLPERFSERFPLRGAAWFSFAVAALLAVMWAGRIGPALRGDLSTGMLLGQTTLVVQGLDLGLIVPLGIITGVMAWRGRPLGYLLSFILAVKGAAMAAAISLMVIVAGIVEHGMEWGPLGIFLAATAGALWLGVRMFRAEREERPGRASDAVLRATA